ncbi:MAG TPA: zinc metalloprotease [Candidatus Limnocylindrales bacterium]|nr:zinc metalloprotease [Candidatus Limnocylindrales bacterium]
MSSLRRARTLASAVVLSLAQVTPAAALAAPGLTGASGSPSWACTPDSPAITARGGIADSRGNVREKDTGQVVSDMPKSAKGRAPASLTVSVPIYFHVITSGSTGDVTNARLAAQVTQMNRAYSGGFGGPDTGFSFTLAGVDRTDNATWYASKSGGAEHAMKQALKVGGDDVLNVYTTSGGAYLGWAYLPEITDTAQAYLDGIVIDWRTVPGASDDYEGLYDEGDTLVHEAGHWLNLEHTFFGQCNKTGDFVADTPAEKSAAFGCQVGRDTCPAEGLDPVHNYMDYSDDPCLTEFTEGQAQRMRDAWLLWRAS